MNKKFIINTRGRDAKEVKDRYLIIKIEEASFELDENLNTRIGIIFPKGIEITPAQRNRVISILTSMDIAYIPNTVLPTEKTDSIILCAEINADKERFEGLASLDVLFDCIVKHLKSLYNLPDKEEIAADNENEEANEEIAETAETTPNDAETEVVESETVVDTRIDYNFIRDLDYPLNVNVKIKGKKVKKGIYINCSIPKKAKFSKKAVFINCTFR